MNSWRSNTTRASICQYIALWKPLCSNHILPGKGQGIRPLIHKKTWILKQIEIQHHTKNKILISRGKNNFSSYVFSIAFFSKLLLFIVFFLCCGWDRTSSKPLVFLCCNRDKLTYHVRNPSALIRSSSFFVLPLFVLLCLSFWLTDQRFYDSVLSHQTTRLVCICHVLRCLLWAVQHLVKIPRSRPWSFESKAIHQANQRN